MHTLIPDDYATFKKMFALSHGHSEECVDETIQSLVSVLQHMCKGFNISLEEVLLQMGAEHIENRISQILEEKECECLVKRN